MKKLEAVLHLIVTYDKDTLKWKYKDHALQRSLKGLRELHIQSDWLLVYKVENDCLELWLLATGKHDDVFRSSQNF